MECGEPAEDTMCLERKKGTRSLYKDNQKQRFYQEACFGFLIKNGFILKFPELKL